MLLGVVTFQLKSCSASLLAFVSASPSFVSQADLPPYSPDFNLIENCLLKVKEYLRSTAARSYQAFDPAITEAFKALNQNCRLFNSRTLAMFLGTDRRVFRWAFTLEEV